MNGNNFTADIVGILDTIFRRKNFTGQEKNINLGVRFIGNILINKILNL